jgi:hypothetical protein
LTGNQIKQCLGTVKIIPYSKVKQFFDVYKLLDPFDAVVILYRTDDNYGHWTCLLQNQHGIEFFCSYGVIIDDQLDQNKNPHFQMQYGQDHTYLTKLLYECTSPISYNHHKFQEYMRDDGVRPETCGRHVIMRLMNKNLGLDEYKNKLDSERGDRTYDELVCDLI